MTDVPEVSEILTWPQAVFGAVVLLALVVVPQVLTFLQSRSTKADLRAVKHQTENNSGSTMRDAVDRIESTLNDHVEQAAGETAEFRSRLAALEEKKRRLFKW